MTDIEYMKIALDLAKKGRGFVNPNPMVGAVVVKDNEIIGQGYHEKYGHLHAERNAIADCKVSPMGATIYVTLEPCCHYGKTPPCTDAIIESGIKKVVIGSSDPNPLVAGKGVEILKSNNIEVVENVLKEECDKLNEVFFHYIKTKTPYVVMKYAMTMDGKIATYTGKSKWITGEESRLNVHKDRHKYSGIMVGVGTSRDAWVYNYSKNELVKNIRSFIDFYNSEIKRLKEKQRIQPDINVTDEVSKDPTKISWSSSLFPQAEKFLAIEFQGDKVFDSMYRPFQKQHLYYGEKVIHRRGQFEQLYPHKDVVTPAICMSSSKGFTAVLTNIFPDLHFVGDSQCFPLYWYEENKNQQGTLFDIGSEDKYIRRDGISDWILKEVRSRFGNTKSLTKEHIFYYVYGLLHSEQYRAKFTAELKKSLPRIPIVERAEDFMSFYKAGKELADLHVNYEEVPACPEVMVDGDNPLGDPYAFYSVQKMRFPAKGQKDTIIYNGHIRITNIPAKAYEYVVNGKSAIEWIMERYQVTVDDGKNGSMIKNDPNDWSREHSKPRYILDLLLSVINVSIKTVDIVNGLQQINI